MSSFKTSSEIFASPFGLPAKLNFQNYANAWTTAGIRSFFFNSVIVVFGALIVTMAGVTFPVFLAIVPMFFVLRGMGC